MSSGKVVWVQPEDHTRIKAISDLCHWDFGVVVSQALDALQRDLSFKEIKKYYEGLSRK